MKRLVIVLLFAFTLFMVNQKEAHANIEFDHFEIVETILISNELAFGPNELNIKGYVLAKEGDKSIGYKYLSYMPNEQSASLYYGQYYLNVKYILWSYTEYYAVMSMYSGVELFLGEIYIYLPDLENVSFFLVPGQSDYDAGYQIGYQEGQGNGFQHAFDSGYNHGIEVGYGNGYETAFNDTYDLAYGIGYNDALAEGDNYWGVAFGSLTSGFSALFGITLLPGITVGMLASIPVIFGLLAFLLSLGGKKK